MSNRPILVVGAGGALGREIVRVLRANEQSVIATYRTSKPGVEESLIQTGAEAIQLDVSDTTSLASLVAQTQSAIFTPILTASGHAAPLLPDRYRAVFFSSNNVAIDPEAEIYARLLEAEAQVLKAAPLAMILRPTMVYGYPGDGNMSQLLKILRRSPLIPVARGGAALQQPVYYKDLARVAADLAASDAAYGKGIVAVAGPEPMTQRAVIEAAACAIGINPIIAPAPLGAAASILRLLEAIGVALPVKAAQLARAKLDKIPRNTPVILTKTRLEEGLHALVEALDVDRSGA